MSERTLEGLRREWRETHKEGWHLQECCVDELLDELGPVMERFWQIVDGMEHKMSHAMWSDSMLFDPACDKCQWEKLGGERR